MNNQTEHFAKRDLARRCHSDDGKEQAGMGVGVGDTISMDTSIFQNPLADDATLFIATMETLTSGCHRISRLGVETRYVVWGAGIVDLDNDGYPDLFMTTGHVDPKIEKNFRSIRIRRRARFSELDKACLKN